MTDTERMDAATVMSEDTQRRQWHEEDLQRLQKALCWVAVRIFGVALLVLAIGNAVFWFISYEQTSDIRETIISEKSRAEEISKRVDSRVSIDKFEALDGRLKDVENEGLTFRIALAKIEKALERVDGSVGTANATILNLSRDLSREAEVRDKLVATMERQAAAMDKLSERLDEQPIR